MGKSREDSADGLERFADAILLAARTEIGVPSRDDPLWKEAEEAVNNVLFDRPAPTRVQRELSDGQKFFGAIFSGFSEAHTAYQRLKDHEVYIGRYPFAGTSITRVAYLSHVIETYLSECYILQQRLVGYLGTIEKQFRSSRRRSDLYRVTARLKEMVNTSFSELAKVRGMHVHDQRYYDRDLDKLETLDLLSRTSGGLERVLQLSIQTSSAPMEG